MQQTGPTWDGCGGTWDGWQAPQPTPCPVSHDPVPCTFLAAGGAWQCGFEKQSLATPEGNAAIYVLLLKVGACITVNTHRYGEGWCLVGTGRSRPCTCCCSRWVPVLVRACGSGAWTRVNWVGFLQRQWMRSPSRLCIYNDGGRCHGRTAAAVDGGVGGERAKGVRSLAVWCIGARAVRQSWQDYPPLHVALCPVTHYTQPPGALRTPSAWHP